jgi:hypothetical protein
LIKKNFEQFYAVVNASAQWVAALGYESEDKKDSLYGKTRGAKSHVGFLKMCDTPFC